MIYEFADSRAGEKARAFLGKWRGKLVCDDYSAYKAGFELGITEIGCIAHARRKFGYETARQLGRLGYRIWLGSRDARQGSAAVSSSLTVSINHS
ncbi:hypothetical protein Bpla01_25550 [Burkholderia plantarii]|nr:hypothetical protein Bpla01_25550 [Burkholderia plantarii]